MSAQGRGRIFTMCLPLFQRKIYVMFWGVWGPRCGHNYNCKWHRKLSQIHRNPWEQCVIHNCYPFFLTRTIYLKTTMHQSTALKTLIITKHEIGWIVSASHKNIGLKLKLKLQQRFETINTTDGISLTFGKVSTWNTFRAYILYCREGEEKK